MKKVLRFVFFIDALITISFGLYSWFAPLETFGTIISIPETDNAVVLAILSSLSVLYILLGITALVGAMSKPPVSIWIALLMMLRHGWLVTMKIRDIGQEWLIGNPYPDIIIHSIFVCLYATGIYLIFNKKS